MDSTKRNKEEGIVESIRQRYGWGTANAIATLDLNGENCGDGDAWVREWGKSGATLALSHGMMISWEGPVYVVGLLPMEMVRVVFVE